MPRRTILSDTELTGLLALPDTEAEAIRRFTFSDADLAIISQHRGPANRLGFAVQLCYMRYPGVVLAAGDTPSTSLLQTNFAVQAHLVVDGLASLLELLLMALLSRVEDPAEDAVMQINDLVGHGSDAFDRQSN